MTTKVRLGRNYPLYVVVFVYGAPRLTAAKIEAACAEAPVRGAIASSEPG